MSYDYISIFSPALRPVTASQADTIPKQEIAREEPRVQGLEQIQSLAIKWAPVTEYILVVLFLAGGFYAIRAIANNSQRDKDQG